MTMGKKIIMSFMAVLLLASLVKGYSVTVYNPAKMLLNVLIDDQNVQMETGIMSLELNRGEQSLNFTAGQGDRAMSVDVKDGDVLVLIPEPLGGGANGPAVQLVEIPGETDYSSAP